MRPSRPPGWRRVNNPHLFFGGGTPTASVPPRPTETGIAPRAILDRMPDLAQTAVPVRRPSFTIRGAQLQPALLDADLNGRPLLFRGPAWARPSSWDTALPAPDR